MANKIKLIIPVITSVAAIICIILYLVTFNLYKDLVESSLISNLLALIGALLSILGILVSVSSLKGGKPDNRPLWGVGFASSISLLHLIFLMRVLISGFHIGCLGLWLPFSLLFFPLYLIMLVFYIFEVIFLFVGFIKDSKVVLLLSLKFFIVCCICFVLALLPDIPVLIFR